MEYKITNTGDYLLIVDDSEIKELKWVFNNISNEIYLSIDTHMDYQYKIIAHLPINSPILEGVDLLPPLEDDVEKLAEEAIPLSNENIDYIEFAKHDRIQWVNGYNKHAEKYKYKEEDLRKAYEGVLQNVGTCIKQSDLPTFEQYLEYINKPKMPTGFKCEIIDTSNMGVTLSYPLTKTTTNSQGLTQWVGEYIY
jgi:hypothetical protein